MAGRHPGPHRVRQLAHRHLPGRPLPAPGPTARQAEGARRYRQFGTDRHLPPAVRPGRQILRPRAGILRISDQQSIAAPATWPPNSKRSPASTSPSATAKRSSPTPPPDSKPTAAQHDPAPPGCLRPTHSPSDFRTRHATLTDAQAHRAGFERAVRFTSRWSARSPLTSQRRESSAPRPPCSQEFAVRTGSPLGRQRRAVGGVIGAGARNC